MNGEFTLFQVDTVNLMMRLFDVNKTDALRYEKFWYVVRSVIVRSSSFGICVLVFSRLGKR